MFLKGRVPYRALANYLYVCKYCTIFDFPEGLSSYASYAGVKESS